MAVGHYRWVNRISSVLPLVFVSAISAANLMDLAQCVPVVWIARRHDDTTDMLPNQLRIRPLSRTKLNTIRSERHDRVSETNGAAHDVRNESMRSSDVYVNPCHQLLCRENKFPSPNRLCEKGILFYYFWKKGNWPNGNSFYFIQYLNLSLSWTLSGWWWPGKFKPIAPKKKLPVRTICSQFFNTIEGFGLPKTNITNGIDNEIKSVLSNKLRRTDIDSIVLKTKSMKKIIW